MSIDDNYFTKAELAAGLGKPRRDAQGRLTCSKCGQTDWPAYYEENQPVALPPSSPVAESPTELPEHLQDWSINHRGDLVACAKLLRKVPTLNEAVDILAKTLRAAKSAPSRGNLDPKK